MREYTYGLAINMAAEEINIDKYNEDCKRQVEVLDLEEKQKNTILVVEWLRMREPKDKPGLKKENQ